MRQRCCGIWQGGEDQQGERAVRRHGRHAPVFALYSVVVAWGLCRVGGGSATGMRQRCCGIWQGGEDQQGERAVRRHGRHAPVFALYSVVVAWGLCRVGGGSATGMRQRCCGIWQGGEDQQGERAVRRHGRHAPVFALYSVVVAWGLCRVGGGSATGMRQRCCGIWQGGEDQQGERAVRRHGRHAPVFALYSVVVAWGLCRVGGGSATGMRQRCCGIWQGGEDQQGERAVRRHGRHAPVFALYSVVVAWGLCRVGGGSATGMRQRCCGIWQGGEDQQGERAVRRHGRHARFSPIELVSSGSRSSPCCPKFFPIAATRPSSSAPHGGLSRSRASTAGGTHIRNPQLA
ncbi:hypothetical protein GUJ93_ZPchr0001g29705 [Zizania palustris]|uniref:Uncharacterized protein n=1 Tax=Zizania palustris TaxID=103762 RepID=A0A8J5RW49_ZIZPA|nr:hypothetical protein GUJ93_ZPchr0001g29705 [Zizania palustris]